METEKQNENCSPLHRVEVRRPVMTSNCVQQVIEDTDTHSASPLTHWCHHSPLVGLRIVTFYTGNGVTAAPTANYETRGGATREETITQIVSGLRLLDLTHRKVLSHADLQTGPLRSGLASWAWFWVPASAAFLVAATGSSSLHQLSLWKTALTLRFRGWCYFL